MTIRNTFMARGFDPDKVCDVIRDCADRIIMPRFKTLQQHEVGTKTGPTDLVTIADKEMEAELSLLLPAVFPGSVVIGEESVSEGTKSLDVLKDKTQAVWVVDPVDGTYNFVQGKDEFAVLLALVVNGETAMGWLYDVPGRRFMIAEKGGGTYFDGQKMKVAAPPSTLDQAIGYAAYKYFPKAVRPWVQQQSALVKDVGSLFCAGHEYMRLASGGRDFAIYNKLKPWDHLAGALAVQESGGQVFKWNGTPYTPQDTGGGLIAASDTALWQDVHRTFISSTPPQPPKPPGT